MNKIREQCPECDDSELLFWNYGDADTCGECNRIYVLGSYWESDEGVLVNELDEVIVDNESDYR